MYIGTGKGVKEKGHKRPVDNGEDSTDSTPSKNDRVVKEPRKPTTVYLVHNTAGNGKIYRSGTTSSSTRHEEWKIYVYEHYENALYGFCMLCVWNL